MLDIRDHGGIFGGGKKSTLFLPKSPNAGRQLFDMLDESNSIQANNGNYYVFFINNGMLVREEYNKSGTLIASINTTPPKSPWSGIFIKNKSIMIYTVEGNLGYIYKFDINLNLIQTFTTSYVSITFTSYKDVNENGWIAGVNDVSSIVVYNQNGTEVARFPNSMFATNISPVWLNDDLLLASRSSSGAYALCSVSSLEISPSIFMDTRFGVVFKKLVDMMQLKTV